jgi:hypothetical protein
MLGGPGDEVLVIGLGLRCEQVSRLKQRIHQRLGEQ